MEEQTTLLYVMAIATIVNTVLLIILAIALIRLALVTKKVMSKVETLLDYAQKEILSTMAVARKAIQQVGSFLEKVAPAVQRYMTMAALRKFVSPRLSRVLSGVGFGYGLFQTYLKFTQNREKKS